MAYLRDLPRCRDCGKPAAVELMNSRNSVSGAYCRPHGNQRLRKLLKEEARALLAAAPPSEGT